jgi:osmotically-inducible protein OsmY
MRATLLIILSICLVLSGCAWFADKQSNAPDSTVFDDNILGSKLQLSYARQYRNANIDVNSYNGCVLLTGQVRTLQDKVQIEQQTKNTQGVITVHNYLQVRLTQSIAASSYDSLITTRVKFELLSMKNVHSNNIKVVTNDRVVYLLGKVKRKDARIIADAVAKLNGVAKVVLLYEYSN